MEKVLEGIQPRVTAEMNNLLTTLCTAAEVKDALFSMSPTKSPGPDGFQAIFFQKNWEWWEMMWPL